MNNLSRWHRCINSTQHWWSPLISRLTWLTLSNELQLSTRTTPLSLHTASDDSRRICEKYDQSFSNLNLSPLPISHTCSFSMKFFRFFHLGSEPRVETIKILTNYILSFFSLHFEIISAPTVINIRSFWIYILLFTFRVKLMISHSISFSLPFALDFRFHKCLNWSRRTSHNTLFALFFFRSMGKIGNKRCAARGKENKHE